MLANNCWIFSAFFFVLVNSACLHIAVCVFHFIDFLETSIQFRLDGISIHVHYTILLSISSLRLFFRFYLELEWYEMVFSFRVFSSSSPDAYKSDDCMHAHRRKKKSHPTISLQNSAQSHATDSNFALSNLNICLLLKEEKKKGAWKKKKIHTRDEAITTHIYTRKQHHRRKRNTVIVIAKQQNKENKLTSITSWKECIFWGY